MDPLNPPVSIMLALWAPSPSSRGLSLVEGVDGAHDVIDSIVDGIAGAPSGSGRVGLEQWLTAARPLSRVSGRAPASHCSRPTRSGSSAEPIDASIPSEAAPMTSWTPSGP